MPLTSSPFFFWFMLLTSIIGSYRPISAFRFGATTFRFPNFLLRPSSSAQTCQTMREKPTIAKRVSSESLDDCGARLRSGGLVAFPTETVYGLGCHALDPDAVSKVFAAKERPFTDPLIVHVTETSHAIRLWNAPASSDEGRALRLLCDTFWPGPLTLVAEAASSVPHILMANTGYVACRSPSHSLARSLIAKANVPIAAPSANKYGHVSPTRAHHVFEDLQYEDVWIVEENNSTVCHVGVESTVAKVITENKKGSIILLRQGAVSAEDIQCCLTKNGLEAKFTVQVSTNRKTAQNVATVAPGQTIRHYAPNIPSFLVSHELFEDYELSEADKSLLSSTVLIDYGQSLINWKPHSCSYRDLSATGDSSEAAQAVFETLRWAEQVEGASRILFPELCVSDKTDALTLALKDRLTRAASGELFASFDEHKTKYCNK